MERRFADFFESHQHGPFPYLFISLAICPGFVKADALAMARHAELQTVDANQTVFSKGFGPSAFSLYPAMLLHSDSILCSNTTLGEVGNEFYFVLQGSVKMKVNSKVVKVRCSLTLLAPLTELIIAPYPPILITTYPILHRSSGPWRQDFIRRACDAVQVQTLCHGWCGCHSDKQLNV